MFDTDEYRTIDKLSTVSSAGDTQCRAMTDPGTSSGLAAKYRDWSCSRGREHSHSPDNKKHESKFAGSCCCATRCSPKRAEANSMKICQLVNACSYNCKILLIREQHFITTARVIGPIELKLGKCFTLMGTCPQTYFGPL